MEELIEVNVAEATGAALDWMVADAEGLGPVMRGGTPCSDSRLLVGKWPIPSFSTSWSYGGLLLDKHCKSFGCVQDSTGSNWRSFAYGNSEACDSIKTMRLAGGPTILIAACRSIVTAKLGDKVMVPVELVDNIENVQPGAGMREV